MSDMVLKFGKYKGKTVEEVAQDKRGRGWLTWACENMFDPNDAKYGDNNKKWRKHIVSVLGNSGDNDKNPDEMPDVDSVEAEIDRENRGGLDGKAPKVTMENLLMELKIHTDYLRQIVLALTMRDDPLEKAARKAGAVPETKVDSDESEEKLPF